MTDKAQLERIDKYLSNHGVASRRGIKKFFKDEDVTVNGEKVTEAGFRFDPEKDDVRVNGKKILTSKLVYYLLNKPKGYLSTTADELNRENVLSLVPSTKRIYPVGRLDKDTTGLLILTNDGELTHKLTHPRYHIGKVYILTILGKVTKHQLDEFRRGVLLDDGVTLPAKVEVIQENSSTTILKLTIFEGRNRQIRRMCKELGLDLIELERIAIGPITKDEVPLGKYRELTEGEVKMLQKMVANPRTRRQNQ